MYLEDKAFLLWVGQSGLTQFDVKEMLCVVLNDFIKALFTLNHSLFCKMLESYGFRSKKLYWIKSYILNRQHRITWDYSLKIAVDTEEAPKIYWSSLISYLHQRSSKCHKTSLVTNAHLGRKTLLKKL